MTGSHVPINVVFALNFSLTPSSKTLDPLVYYIGGNFLDSYTH